MASGRADVIQQLHRLFGLGAVGGMTDAQLLARFVARRDEGGELAFEALVERHGPMVFRICRGVLRDEHAAEDAFQATFLVLARKARSLWVKDSLGSWLFGVAHRVAAKARSDARRRRRHERQVAEGATEAISPVVWSDVEAALSEEIDRLPEKYRAPVILCCLEAMSYEMAASHLGVTEGAVRGRLARARERLRSRLIRRGHDLAGLPMAASMRIGAAPAVRPGLVRTAIQAAMSLSVGRAVNRGAISESALSLSERVVRTMMLTNVKTAVVALALGAVAAGAVVLAQPAGGGREQSGPAPASRQPPLAGRGQAGNLIIDWLPAERKPGKREVIVDAARHCVHLAETSVKRDDRPNDGTVRLDLERGKTYTVTAAGEAFMSAQTGVDADPFPGVVLFYGTDEEDGYAIRQVVLAPGRSITFRTPWLINPKDEVYLIAFFLDVSPQDTKRGGYKLTITEAGEPGAVKWSQRNVEFLRQAPSADVKRVEGDVDALLKGSASSPPQYQDSEPAANPQGRQGRP